MSYPDPRYLGEHGEISAQFRPAMQGPELTIGLRTEMRYLSTGASTNEHFGLYRVDGRRKTSAWTLCLCVDRFAGRDPWRYDVDFRGHRTTID